MPSIPWGRRATDRPDADGVTMSGEGEIVLILDIAELLGGPGAHRGATLRSVDCQSLELCA